MSVFNTLERAMKGPRFQTPQPKIDRMVDIEMACKLILADIINPSAFIATHGNPGSRTVREMLKQADIGDVFGNIKPRFEKRWGQPIPSTFIVDKLDEVVNRRHVVAHMVNALNITRVELRESLKFLGILSELLDIELRAKVKALR